MSNSIAPGSSADVNVRVTALTTNPNVPVTYKTIILKKNLVNGVNTLTQEMMSAQNTKYVVKYDYVLGNDITIPENCVLEFDGGSIGGEYKLTGNNTNIKANETDIIFSSVLIKGNWCVTDIYANWYSDIQSIDIVRNLFNLCSDSLHNNIYIPSSVNCLISATKEGVDWPGEIELTSNTTIYLDGTIKIDTNNFYGYSILITRGKENVVIKGSGSIIGDKDTHIPTEDPDHLTFEWCYGLNILRSRNIIIDGITLTNFPGDGIFITNAWDSYPSNVRNNITINNITISNCRRQGISILESDGIEIKNFIIENIAGTLPSAAIDIEPFNGDLKNVNIHDGIIKNVSVGIGTWRPTPLSGEPNYISNIVIHDIEMSCDDSVNYPFSTPIGIAKAKDVNISRISATGYNSACFNINWSRNVEIAECDINNDGEYSISTFDNGAFYTNNKNINISNCLIRQKAVVSNVVFEDSIFKCGIANALSGLDQQNQKDVILHNCILVNSAISGLYDNLTIDNCTIYYYDRDGAQWHWMTCTCNRLYINNNKIYTTRPNYSVSKNVEIKNNTWYGILNVPLFQNGSTTLYADVAFNIYYGDSNTSIIYGHDGNEGFANNILYKNNNVNPNCDRGAINILFPIPDWLENI